jgi:hypothetical protein
VLRVYLVLASEVLLTTFALGVKVVFYPVQAWLTRESVGITYTLDRKATVLPEGWQLFIILVLNTLTNLSRNYTGLALALLFGIQFSRKDE